jgi:hypothetical protein
VAFADPTSRSLRDKIKFKNAHRTRCPYCKEDRYLPDGTTPRRVVYYFPIACWLQELFTRPELIHLMDVEISPSMYPSGSVRRSDGWRRKVLRNPKMRGDRRNQAISGACDGVPFFKDRNAAGGWVTVLHAENCPPGIARSPYFSHMVALAPSNFLRVDEDGNVKTIKRS